MRIPLTDAVLLQAQQVAPQPPTKVLASILAPLGTIDLRLTTDGTALLVLHHPHQAFPPGFDPAWLARLLPPDLRPATLKTDTLTQAGRWSQEALALRRVVAQLAGALDAAGAPCPYCGTYNRTGDVSMTIHPPTCPVAHAAAGVFQRV